MNKGKTWRRLAAWVLTASMILGSNSFAVLAEEMTEPQSTAGDPAPAAEESVPVVEESAVIEEEPIQMVETEAVEAPVETEATEAPTETEPVTEAASAGDETQAVSESTATVESEELYEEIPAADAEGEFLIGDELLVTDEATVLSADLLSVDEDGEEETPNYEITMENLRGEGYTWVYSDEDTTVSLNTDNLDGIDYEIEWEAGNWDDEQMNDLLDPQLGYYTVNENHSVTLHGAALEECIEEGENETSFFLQAAVMVNGEEVWSVGTGVSVRRVSYEYYFPIGDDSYLPGDEVWIDKFFGCKVWNSENPDGAYMDAEFIDMEIESDPGVLSEEDWGDGWHLELNEPGNATITLQYKIRDIDMETQAYSFQICVLEEKWFVDLEPGKSTDRMLPGETYDLTANVRREIYEDDGQRYEEDASEGQITWEVAEGAEYVTYESDGNVLHVTANTDVDEWRDVQIVCMVFKDGEEVARNEYWLNISLVYTVVEIEEDLQTLRGLDTGSTTSVTPTLWEYRADEEKRPVESVQYCWEWNEDVLEITDADGKLLTGDDPYGEAPFTVRKLENWWTNVNLIAETEDENGKWSESAKLNLCFEDKDYNIWMNYERDWIFTDEDLTISLDTPSLEGDGYEIEWKAGRWVWDDEDWWFDEFLTAEAGDYTINDDNSITLHGAKLVELLEQDHYVQVMVTLKNNNVVLSEDERGIEICEPNWEWQLPVGSEAHLPYETMWINRSFNCYVENSEHPYGENMEAEIISVEVINDEDTPGAVELDEENEYGWTLRTNEMGHARVKVQYRLADTQMEPETDEFDVWVNGEVWELEVTSSTGSYEILPGDSLDLTARLYCRCYDEERGHYNGDTSDCRIEWFREEGAEEISITQDEDDQMVCHVTADESWSDYVARIVAYAYAAEPDEDVDPIELTYSDVWINVRDAQYQIKLKEDIDAFRDLECGEKAAVTPSLWWRAYDEETQEVDAGSVRYRWDWDEEALEITDADGKVLTGENPYGKAPFTIKKLQNWRTGARLYAEVWDEYDEDYYQQAELELVFGEQDYSVWLDDLRGENHTWVFTDEDLDVFLNTESLAGKTYEIEWRVGVWNEEEEALNPLLPQGCYTVDAEADSITLHGDKLGAALAEMELDHFDLHYTVMVNGVEVDGGGIGVSVREPRLEIEDDDSADMLVGGSFHYNDGTMWGYIENKDYPEGRELSFTIQDITSSDEEVWKPEDDGTIWWVRAAGFGTAEITYHLNCEELGDISVTRTKGVTGEIYRVYAESDTQTFCLLPGASLKLLPVVQRSRFDEETGENVYELLENLEGYTVEYTDIDDGMISVADDGTVTAKDNSGETGIHVVATIPLENGDSYVNDTWVSIYVQDRYDVLTAETTCAQPGQTLTAEDVKAVLTGYSVDEPEGVVKENVAFTFETWYVPENPDDPHLEISEDGKTAVVVAPNLTADDDMTALFLRIKAHILDASGNPMTNENGEVIEYLSGAEIRVCVHTWDGGNVHTAPTCTETGLDIYTCTKCQAQELRETKAAGHKLTHHAAKAATCTAAGNVEYWSCGVCGKNFSNAAGTVQITGSTVTPASGHKLTYHAAKAATCTAAGNVAYWSCSVCKKNFSNANGTAQLTSTAIPASGHKMGAWTTVTAATVFAAQTQRRNCTVCGHAETRQFGSPLPKVLTLTDNKQLVMKTKQSTTAFKVTAMAAGDSLKSVVSSDTKIVKVSNVKANGTLKLTAQSKKGSAKITFTLASGLSKTITVKVQSSKVKTTGISGVQKSITLDKGKKATLKPTLAPVTSQEKISYSSSNKKVATVSSKGVITAKKAGTAKITVKSGKKKVTVTVKVNGIKTTKITNVKSAVTLKKGKKLTLKPKLTPKNSDDKITYKTSNKKIVSVTSKGVIKGLKKGEATITVISGSQKVTCKVTVN